MPTVTRKVRPLFAGALGAALIAALVGFAPVWSASPVPPAYADLYASLDARLTAIDRVVASRSSGANYDTVFSAELLPANANAGEALFREQTWPVVLLNLDRLQQVGVRGVKVAIKYAAQPEVPRADDGRLSRAGRERAAGRPVLFGPHVGPIPSGEAADGGDHHPRGPP